MKDKRYMRTLIDYNAWANAEMYDAVQALPPEEIAKERPTLLRSILLSLNHLLVVDLIWMAHLESAEHGFDQLRTLVYESFEELRQARKEMDARLARYVDGLSPAALEEQVDYTLIGGNTGRLSRAMILTHLAMHGSYHRGWIADMLELPRRPPAMDIPVYERFAREAGLEPLP